MMGNWSTVEENIYFQQFEPEHVNVGLIVGAERALLVDSGAGGEHSARVLEAAHEITDVPLVVVNTHGHWDHLDGNEVFAQAGVTEFWAHRTVADARSENARSAQSDGATEQIEFLQVEDTPVELDLGGITASLLHLGRAHTDGDILVSASNTLFTGDIVEEGGDPNFEDSFPNEWINVLGKVLALSDLHQFYVPGHGSQVTEDYVSTFMNKMRSGIRVTKLAMNDASTDLTKAIPILPYGPHQSRVLLQRLRELANWEWLAKK